MSNYTLTYSDSTEGWVSFYSYYPDWMLGMNNYFYTWKGGDLYRHNSNNEDRNTFYRNWWIKYNGQPSNAFSPSTLRSVFNQANLENKLFKTIDLQGDDTWSMQLSTDLQTSGYIDAVWFERKESTYFAFVRNNEIGQFALRSLNGIGASISENFGFQIGFSINPLVVIDSIASVGDYLYFIDIPTSNAVNLAGQITLIERDYPAGVNRITINTGIPGTTPIPNATCTYFYVKNSVAESHGVLGHYCVFSMQNYNTDKIELFTVEADVMKSYP